MAKQEIKPPGSATTQNLRKSVHICGWCKVINIFQFITRKDDDNEDAGRAGSSATPGSLEAHVKLYRLLVSRNPSDVVVVLVLVLVIIIIVSWLRSRHTFFFHSSPCGCLFAVDRPSVHCATAARCCCCCCESLFTRQRKASVLNRVKWGKSSIRSSWEEVVAFGIQFEGVE